MQSTLILDEISNRPEGDLIVKPFSSSGPLSDPFQIFKYPTEVFKHTKTIPNAIKCVDETGYIPLGSNLVVNLGRQTIAYLLGGKEPVSDWAITKASFGTFDEVPRFTDSTLSPQPTTQNDVVIFTGGEHEITVELDEDENPVKKIPITAVDFPQQFIVRFEITLGENQANGYLIREMGLWTENETLFARKAHVAISKSEAFGLAFLWRIRV